LPNANIQPVRSRHPDRYIRPGNKEDSFRLQTAGRPPKTHFLNNEKDSLPSGPESFFGICREQQSGQSEGNHYQQGKPDGPSHIRVILKTGLIDLMVSSLTDFSERGPILLPQNL